MYKEHLGLSLSTDGVPILKYSLKSLWPVYLTIYNLPPSFRINKEKMILCWVWVGPKPAMKTLHQPVFQMSQSLYTVGITIKVPDWMKTIRATLLTGIFDLVAKAPIVNMNLFNGKYGCLTCTHPSSTYSRGCRIYHPNLQPPAAARKHTTLMQSTQEVCRSGVPENGIEGPSVLAEVMDLVDGIPVDYMHAVVEGVARWLLHTWCDSKNHQKPFYLGRSLHKIDKLLLKQRPPSEISRPPRSLQKHMKYWKESELRNWLLFYSLPLLLNVLPLLYLHHYDFLVCSIHILLQESLTSNQIMTAGLMLQDFI